jgi:hypothetical protein
VVIAGLLLCGLAAGCGSDDASGAAGRDLGGPQPEPPGGGDSMTGGDFGNPGVVQGPGLEPPGAPPPTGVAGAGAMGAAGASGFDGDGDAAADAGVRDGAETLPPGIDSARTGAESTPERLEPADRGMARREPLPDGGVPDGWDEAVDDGSDNAR